MVAIQDVAYVTYQVSNLEKTEAFLKDFGLHRAALSDGRLYMRGGEGAPYVQGEGSRLLSVAFLVKSAEDLEAASRLPGASGVEDLTAPGGGKVVRLAAPFGYAFELVHGIAGVEPLPARDPYVYNAASRLDRPNSVIRETRRATTIRRISHVALRVADVREAVTWFTETLGAIVSDYVETPDGGLAATFLRCDRGADLCDHHVIALVGDKDRTSIHHASFWVEDFDALLVGHDWLTRQGHHHEYGVGRHTLGSQVFDYWRDPDGFMVERFTDGDVFDNTREPGHVPASMEAFFQWGADPRPTFFE